ncbi:tripartite tricarboxylate transporter TctB family protein [Cochlodiniinecator piscidefendens]|uniref:tripartite tricarboxylate transporter TctB family protein n=1 Tax=Cochlodiniinecator piscidefendens TaxID=2715756 RepID=UPI002F3F4E3A
MRLKTFQELFKRDRRPGDLVFAWMFLFFCGFLLINLGGQVQWGMRGSLVAQPAFWPTISVVGMSFFAVMHLIGSLSSPRIPGRMKEFRFWLRSLEYVVYFLAYVSMVPIIGYLLGTLIFALFLTFRLGYRRPTAFCVTAVFAVAVVLIFRAGLRVKIPAGQIYEHLPDAIRSFAMINL